MPEKKEKKTVAASPSSSSSSSATDDDSMPGGSETILLVDDEDAVRRLTSDILKMVGYQVLEADSGAKALEILQSGDAESIQLLVTDVEMPKINGKEVAEKFTTVQPDGSILFISGDIENMISRHAIPSRENFHYLGKPFSPSDLTQKVRRVLDS